MTTLTAQEARSINIFHLEGGEIEENNLYDFVMESAEETTSPRGIEMKLHIRHREEEERWQVWTWGVRGQFPQLIGEFNTEDEAEDEIFQRVYEYDFMYDDQRDCEYWHTYEEAEAARKERAS